MGRLSPFSTESLKSSEPFGSSLKLSVSLPLPAFLKIEIPFLLTVKIASRKRGLEEFWGHLT